MYNGFPDGKETNTRPVTQTVTNRIHHSTTYLDTDCSESGLMLNHLERVKGLIRRLSHRDDRASRIGSAFVVVDRDDETKTPGQKDLYSCVDAVSGMRSTEAAVLH